MQINVHVSGICERDAHLRTSVINCARKSEFASAMERERNRARHKQRPGVCQIMIVSLLAAESLWALQIIFLFCHRMSTVIDRLQNFAGKASDSCQTRHSITPHP